MPEFKALRFEDLEMALKHIKELAAGEQDQLPGRCGINTVDVWEIVEQLLFKLGAVGYTRVIDRDEPEIPEDVYVIVRAAIQKEFVGGRPPVHLGVSRMDSIKDANDALRAVTVSDQEQVDVLRVNFVEGTVESAKIELRPVVVE